MSAFMDDIMRDGAEGEYKLADDRPSYDDRYVYWALGGVAVLTVPLLIGVLLWTTGISFGLKLWLAFGAANLIVWPIVLVAGVVDAARRALRTAKVAKRSYDRKLELRRDATVIEAAAA